MISRISTFPAGEILDGILKVVVRKVRMVFVFFLPDCSVVEFPLTVLSKNECASRQFYFLIIAVKISQFCVLEFVCARWMG